ncbi:MAG: RNA polymerase sigma factor [Chloroflexota bacterium]
MLGERIGEPSGDRPNTLLPNTLVTLETFYEGHHRVALGLAYRILENRADAEDAVQDAFLSVWRALATFDPRVGSIRTWLLSVVRNRAIDVLRSRNRRLECVLEDGRAGVIPTDIATAPAAVADREYVLDLIAGLNTPQQQVLELTYFGGLGHTAIAERLGIPVSTVKGRLRLALDRLRVATQDAAEAFGRAA